MNSAAIPNRIREWRNRRRMSLAELGEAVGLSRSEISKLESGSRRVRADHLVVLAKALKVAPEELMDKETVRDMMGELPPVAAVTPTLAVVHARRQDGAIVVLQHEANMAMEAPPQLANVPGAYAFYMPDTSLEPRVPVGALLYVHPMLPPRSGDLAVVLAGEGIPALASVERRGSVLLASPGKDLKVIDLGEATTITAHRVVGIWLP